MSQRVAVVDMGTNTALLLIAEVNGGQLTPLVDAEQFVRLGENVDATGQISEAALQRLLHTLGAYKGLVEQQQAMPLHIRATSASRDATNIEEVILRVKKDLGLDYRVVSGVQEAEWGFVGANALLGGDAAHRLVFDIGGGSTEFTGQTPTEGLAQRSLQMGAVRVAERFFKTKPPRTEEVAAAEKYIDGLLATLPRVFHQKTALVGIDGTVASLTLLEHPDCKRADLSARAYHLSNATVTQWLNRLLELDTESVYQLRPDVMEGRADVFPAGVLILSRLLQHFAAPSCSVSAWGMRHGAALALANQG